MIGPTGQGDLSLRPTAIVKNVRARLAEFAEADPPIQPPLLPFAVLCVYRRRNAARVAALDLPVESTFLWALDESAPALAHMTRGRGVGTRFELLNRLEAIRDETDRWLVVIDDDVELTRGTLAQAVATAALGEFDLCAISHSRWSYLNWGCTLHQVQSIARLMSFVEIGPCLLLSPQAQRKILPFRQDVGMGWGVEAVWAGHDDLRMGILDAVHLRHVQPVSDLNYDSNAQWTQASRILDASGFASWSEMQKTVATWKYGECTPPWLDGWTQ